MKRKIGFFFGYFINMQMNWRRYFYILEEFLPKNMSIDKYDFKMKDMIENLIFFFS